MLIAAARQGTSTVDKKWRAKSINSIQPFSFWIISMKSSRRIYNHTLDFPNSISYAVFFYGFIWLHCKKSVAASLPIYNHKYTSSVWCRLGLNYCKASQQPSFSSRAKSHIDVVLFFPPRGLFFFFLTTSSPSFLDLISLTGWLPNVIKPNPCVFAINLIIT